MVYILAIDQGTTSTRALLFDEAGKVCAIESLEFEQIYPQSGWAEHDPIEIIRTVVACAQAVVATVPKGSVKGIGIANQRETTVAWDKVTGKPLYNAIVWLDNRTADVVAALTKDHGIDRFRAKTGLPISTYFSAIKMRWLIDNVPAVKQAVDEKRCCFGTIDSWIVYNLTCGKSFSTDVSNAGRYLLMNLKTRRWDEDVCRDMGIPIDALPEIKSCSEHYGFVDGDVLPELGGVSICGSLGDQHAALLGQGCLKRGDVKNTYGTGCFMLVNTGECVVSTHGLLSTIGFQLGPDAPCVYALEGAVNCAGRLIQWMRDNLGMLNHVADVEKWAVKCSDTAGCVIVPAFQGLFAPYWRNDARAIICGMSLYTTKAHICRAALEAVAFQSFDLIRAMEKDMDSNVTVLHCDGGMTGNALLMQIQADIAQLVVKKTVMPEATALGAAFAAGLHSKIWTSVEDVLKLIERNGGHESVSAKQDGSWRDKAYAVWQDAVPRTYNLSHL
eukprot:GEMP01007041.1.p1 GENE.GEMP01007041.1~~GEMP01007041.1.p1  ORF type:complete len:501 (+),score=112.52 GEMP01007041.1:223-1725(+)